MTREEATNRIQNHMEVFNILADPHVKIVEALNMAISALREQEERSKPKESQPSDWHIPMTNADRIRSISDEEFAAFLCKKFGCHSETCPGIELCKPNEGKANGLLHWLQKPAEPMKEE